MTNRGVVGMFLLMLILPLVLGTAVQPAAANSCAAVDAMSIQSHAGHWWILVSGGVDTPADVYQYTRDWTLVNRIGIDLQSNQTANETDHFPYRFRSMAPAQAGGWWVLGGHGTVYHFDDNLEYTGTKHQLSGIEYDAYDIARVNGSWWALGRGGVWHFTDNWTDPTSHDIIPPAGFPTLGLSADNNHIWAVDSDDGLYHGGNVHRFTPNVGTGFIHDRKVVLDWETSRPTDIAKGPDGRWVVLEDDGGIVEYTSYWQHTGAKREVTQAIGYCGMSYEGLVFPTIGLILFFTALIGLGMAWYRYDHQTAQMGVVTGIGGAVIALLFVTYGLPWPISIIYLLPDRIIGMGLTGGFIASLLLIRARADSRVSLGDGLFALKSLLRGEGVLKDALTVLLIQSPLVVVALLFLT